MRGGGRPTAVKDKDRRGLDNNKVEDSMGSGEETSEEVGEAMFQGIRQVSVGTSTHQCMGESITEKQVRWKGRVRG